jgi:MFS family permease
MVSAATTQDPGGGTAVRFGVRHVLALIALVWTAQLVPLDQVMFGNSQAKVAIHFQTGQIAWYTVITTLVGTFAIPFVVKAADLFGKRRLIIAIAVAGVLGGVLAAAAPNFPVLLIGRGVTGLFFGPIAALVYALTRDIFPARNIGLALGFITGTLGLVSFAGQFLTGWLLDTYDFRGTLWFMAAATAVALVLIVAFVPESPLRNDDRAFDGLGAVLIGGGITAIVYALGKGAHWGWTSATFLGFVAAGLVAIAVFAVVETRVAAPLFPMSLLTRRVVWPIVLSTALLAGTIFSGAVISQLLGLMPHLVVTVPGYPAPIHVSDGLGYSATKMAWIGSPASVVMILTAVATGLLARRLDARRMLLLGGLFGVAGFLLLAHWHHDARQLALAGLCSAVGMGVLVAVGPTLIVEAVAPEEQALTNGMQGLAQGLVAAVVTQGIFVVMAHGSIVARGIQFYNDAGFTHGYLLVAGVLAVGVLSTVFLARVRRLDDAAAETL